MCFQAYYIVVGSLVHLVVSGFPCNFVFLAYLIFFSREPNIVALMIVSVIAAFFQFFILVPATRHMGYRYRLGV